MALGRTATERKADREDEDEKAKVAERLAMLAEQLHTASFELQAMVNELRTEQSGPQNKGE